MGLTLDQLLDATGVSNLAGPHQKQASAPKQQDLSKLAALCREAVNATPEDRGEAEARSLIEKTAAVEIIRRTLAEIRSIGEGNSPGVEKVASPPGPHRAAFIKSALEQGHSHEAIAKFLESLEQQKKTKAPAKTSSSMIG